MSCLLWVLCFFRYRTLRRADHSSRGVLPNVVRRCLWSSNVVNEEGLAQWGLLCQKEKRNRNKLSWVVFSLFLCSRTLSLNISFTAGVREV
jgi:hypothetical protein